MTMTGFDVSFSGQDANLGELDSDFAIIELTSGSRLSNPSAQKQMLQGFGSGKLMGCVHVAAGGDVVAEAKLFASKFRPYVGRAVPFLSVECGASPEWALEWLDIAYIEGGVRPCVRISRTGLMSSDWADVAENRDVWDVDGTNIGDIPPWRSPLWLRDGSEGRISCDGVCADLFLGDAEAWSALCARKPKR